MEGSTLYVILGLLLAGGVGAVLMLLRGLRVGMATGEARERAREAIAEIKDAVERGDDAEVQRRLLEKLHDGKK